MQSLARVSTRPVVVLVVHLVLLGMHAAGNPGATRAEDSAPFEAHAHEIPGLIRQVWPLDVSDCPAHESDLLVLSTDGTPPGLRKIATWMPCGTATLPGDSRIREYVLDRETVVVDVVRIPGSKDAKLIEVSAKGLKILSLGRVGAPRTIEIPGGLPLPARPWSISRTRIVEDWNDLGPPSALLPAPRGAWSVDLVSGATRTIEMPVYAAYRTWQPHLPETVWSWMIQDATWPALARADDNGDGRLDLFALSRWAIWIYHAGPEGIPSEPTRRIELVPFDEETERDHQATLTDYFARDIDGDARADLLLSTIEGGLMDGRSSTRVHLNQGSGVAVDRPPEAELSIEGGFSRFSFVDFEGDGRDELLETSIELDVLQIVRFLLTRRAEMQIRVLALDPETPGGFRTIFEDNISFRVDFSENRVRGLLPNLGEFNGDGRKDFYLSSGDEEIHFRLGQDGSKPFGRALGELRVPLPSGESRVTDLDGDGLDEIVAWSDKDGELPLYVFGNLGRLPGTRPSIRPPASP